MASRRCISKVIYNSKVFLELSPTCRDLYTYLVLYTDNDGVVEAYSVMRMINASLSDLKLLVDARLVIVLNDDWLVYVRDFQTFNTLDARGAASAHRDLLIRVVPAIEDKLFKTKTSKKVENYEELESKLLSRK